MPDLLCAFCFALPPNENGVRARSDAVTIIHGHASCGRHANAAAASVSFNTALAAAELTENRAAMVRMSDELTDARERGKLDPVHMEASRLESARMGSTQLESAQD